MPGSPISAVLDAIDALDVDAFTSLFAADGRLMRTDGNVAEGTEQVRASISDFVADLSANTHEITSEWHPEDGVWIAEVRATYDLKEHGRRGPYPRAIVLRGGPGGITELRVYGLHELPLTEPPHHYQEVLAGSRWLATL
jgi:ketosteroid isomerase-like protein